MAPSHKEHRVGIGGSAGQYDAVSRAQPRDRASQISHNVERPGVEGGGHAAVRIHPAVGQQF